MKLSNIFNKVGLKELNIPGMVVQYVGTRKENAAIEAAWEGLYVGQKLRVIGGNSLGLKLENGSSYLPKFFKKV